MATDIRSLRIVTDARQSAESLDRIDRKMATLGDTAVKVGRQFDNLRGFVAGAVSVDLISNYADKIVQLSNASERLKIPVENLQVLERVARSAGLELADFTEAFITGQELISEAAVEGTGGAAEAIEELGLNVQALARLNPEQQFIALAEALSQVEGEGDQARLAIKLWETEGATLLPIIRQGADGFEELARQAKASGDVLSGDAVRGVVEARAAFIQASDQLAAKLLPMVVKITEGFVVMATVAQRAARAVMRAFGASSPIEQNTAKIKELTNATQQLATVRQQLDAAGGFDPTGKAAERIDALTKRINELNKELGKGKFKESQDGANKAAEAADAANNALGRLVPTLDQVSLASGAAGASADDLAASVTRASAAGETMADVLGGMLSGHVDAAFDAMAKQLEQREAQHEKLRRSLELYAEREQKALEDSRDRWTDAGRAIEHFGGQVDGVVGSLADMAGGVASAFGRGGTSAALTSGAALGGQFISGQFGGSPFGAALGGALQGGAAGASFGPWGAAGGALLGGIMGAFGGGSGDDSYRIRFGGGAGNLEAFAGPDAGNFAPFIQQMNAIERSLLSVADAGARARIEQMLAGWESGTTRMTEGSFDATKAMDLIGERFRVIIGQAFPGELAKLESATDFDGMARIIADVEAVTATLELFGDQIGGGQRGAKHLLHVLTKEGESYTETLQRIIRLQGEADAALAVMAQTQGQLFEFNRRTNAMMGETAVEAERHWRRLFETMNRSPAASVADKMAALNDALAALDAALQERLQNIARAFDERRARQVEASEKQIEATRKQIEAFRESARAAADQQIERRQSTIERHEANRRQHEALLRTAELLTRAADAAGDLLQSLLLSDAAPTSAAQRWDVARNQVTDAAAAFEAARRAGDAEAAAEAADRIRELAQPALQLAEQIYGRGSHEYRMVFDQVAALLGQVESQGGALGAAQTRQQEQRLAANIAAQEKLAAEIEQIRKQLDNRLASLDSTEQKRIAELERQLAKRLAQLDAEEQKQIQAATADYQKQVLAYQKEGQRLLQEQLAQQRAIVENAKSQIPLLTRQRDLLASIEQLLQVSTGATADARYA